MTGNPHPCAVCEGNRRVVRGELPADPRTGRTYVTLAEVLNGALGVPLERHQANSARATSALRRLGWRSGRRIMPGGRKGPKVTPYYSPEANPEADEAETGVREAQEGAG